ncbi:MAG: sulfatase-like hydrolase/transferase [Bacteroidota bacterium]
MKKIFLLSVMLAYTFNISAQHNVMLIIADDLGTDWCGFYEDHVDTASLPHIRTLLSKGVRFQNAMSNPNCSPTRSGIFTGRYSFRTGIGTAIVSPGVYTQLDTAEITIPRLLKIYNPGIGSAQIGKWHLHYPTPSSHLLYPNIMGYDHYAGAFSGMLLNGFYNWSKITDGVSTTSANYATTEQADDAFSWIKTQTNKPFFLWLAFYAPHVPLHLPPAGLYSDTTLSGTQQDIDANPKKYFKADVEALDHELGRLFDSLQVINRLDSTDFIFIGDNGNAPKSAQITDTTRVKGSIYQYGVNVPMIISGPSVVNPGRVSSALVNTADLFATILELFGDTTWQSHIPANKPVDSKSILPIIKNTGTQVRPWAFTELFHPTTVLDDGKAMRNLNYKLLNFDFDGHQEFYNLHNDTAEINNLLQGTLSQNQLAAYSYLCNEMINLTGTGGYCNAAYGIPTLAITSSTTAICPGTTVTFTATAINGGIAPTYQWKKNGINVGTNSSSYSNSVLANGAIISCKLTTASSAIAKSNSILITVNPYVTPSVSISATASTICSGTKVKFTAVPVNGGGSPFYQWKKNGNNTGNNKNTFTPYSLSNGNVISCVLTSNASCTTVSTANSNQITMAVSDTVPAKPGIISGIKYSLCNTTANYTYTISNISNATSYLWIVPSNATIVNGQGTRILTVNYTALFVSGIISVQSLNYCGSSTVRTLNVSAKPATPGAITGLSTVCANQQNVWYSIVPVSGATNYQWAVPAGGSITSGQGSTAIVASFGSTPGNITVFAKNSCGNSAKSTLAVIINCRISGDENMENRNILSVINPFTKELIFSANSNVSDAVVSLYDITGREIYKRRNVSLVKNERQHLHLDGNIPVGIYLLTVKNAETSLTSKVTHQ